eukprot:s436_g44.t1
MRSGRGETEEKRREGEGERYAGRSPGNPPHPPDLRMHDTFGGRGSGAKPHHDWQRLNPGLPSPGTTLADGAFERVDQGHTDLGIPAADALVEPDAGAPMWAAENSQRTVGNSHLPWSFSGMKFAQLGEHLFQSLQMMLWKRASKTQSMAGEIIFPLPLGDYPDVHPEKRPWLKAVLLALNSYAGVDQAATTAPTAMQKRVVSTVLGFLDRLWCWSEVVPKLAFEDLFRVKGVDYRGEEVKLARSFNWECIAAAFPPEVATLNIEDFCTGGCLTYVGDFENFLLPQDQQAVGRPPRTMVHNDDWEEVVYLDNWDELRKVDRCLVSEVEGQPSLQQEALRSVYQDKLLPRHPKKSVQSLQKAEIQGAMVDGEAGIAHAKPDKVLKYMGLAWELVQRGRATQRELQVVAGGLVYISMFRRQLLGGLNAIWKHIEDLKSDPPVVRRSIPREVKGEVIRFCCLIPLAQMDFRLPMEPQVTASDASSEGGGLCASVGLSAYGMLAQEALLRGEVSEPFDQIEVLTIGLFDGIAALRVAAEVLHLPVAGHISVECHKGANRVVEAAFPGTRHVGSVQEVTLAMVKEWACEFSSVGLVLLGAGPPCQGVSGLNSDRLGSQRDQRSSLYKEVPRIRQLVQVCFPWAQVHLLAESVASMDVADREAMSEGFGLTPYQADASGVSLCRRPRLYWLTWEIASEVGLTVELPRHEGWALVTPILLSAAVDQRDFLEAGWFLPPEGRLPTFTTSRPSDRPGRRPAGVKTCDAAALHRWHSDSHRYPPYQYKAENCLHHRSKEVRVASIAEREVILGFPLNYTEQCMAKQQWGTTVWEDMRKTLLENTWSVPVVVLLLKQLVERLGLTPPTSVQSLVTRCAPGHGGHLQTVLQRPPIRREAVGVFPDQGLARRLTTLVSIKGEDLMIQGATEPLVKHQRLRQTVPSRLWKWQEIAGWQWQVPGDHINLLELRAALTSVKWMLQKRKSWNCKVIHLVDSLVVLHSLSRGRSSSRKLKRTLMRINALLLASNLHPVWTYVHTSQNPADRPSRRFKCRKWGKIKKD